MSASHAAYTAEELRRSLEDVGLGRGDTVMLHAGLEALGVLAGAASPSDAYPMV